MSEPSRWRDEDGERGDLVRALAKARPHAGVEDDVWKGVLAALPASASGGEVSSARGGLARSLVPGGVGKVLVVGAAGTAVVAAIAFAVAWRPSPPPAEERVEAAPPSSAPAVAESVPPLYEPPPPVLEPPHRPRAAPPPPVRAPARHEGAEPDAAASPDWLGQEASGVREARRHLRAGNPAAALAELERLARFVPGGALQEERDVLAIEALVATNDRAAARVRARRFLVDYPMSAHASRVRGWADE